MSFGVYPKPGKGKHDDKPSNLWLLRLLHFQGKSIKVYCKVIRESICCDLLILRLESSNHVDIYVDNVPNDMYRLSFHRQNQIPWAIKMIKTRCISASTDVQYNNMD